jgi:hypothetical protein
MTPKQKAKELFNKYYLLIDIKNYENTKNCALIGVDEILDEIQPFELAWEYQSKIEFWNNVKKEIDAL